MGQEVYSSILARRSVDANARRSVGSYISFTYFLNRRYDAYVLATAPKSCCATMNELEIQTQTKSPTSQYEVAPTSRWTLVPYCRMITVFC